MLRGAALTTAFVALPSAARGQATALVPPDARVYRDIERLAAMGLINTLIIGARPFSEREIVRLLNEARRNLTTSASGREWAERTIGVDLAIYQRHELRPLDAIGAQVAATNSPYRLAPTDANGRIDALINPLLAYRAGRPIVDGTTATIESMHSVLLDPHVAVAFNPRVTGVIHSSGGTEAELKVQSGYVNTLFGDFSVQLGRDYAVFGQAPTGGLLLSNNAPALDMIRLSNDRAWNVPWVSRLFGPIRGSLLVADLGASHQLHPHSKLIAYHIATLPNPHLELGVQVTDAMGGNGGQPATFIDRALDAIPIVDAIHTSSDFQFSNKLAGVDLHWRVPTWRGFEFYAEGDADDFDGRNFSRGFLADAGYLFGTSFACLLDCGRIGVRAEYHQTGIRYYTHGDYPMASNQLLLGDPLGPRGLGGYVTIDGDAGKRGRFAFDGAFEARSGNTYRSGTTGAHEAGFHFELVDRRPSEKRARVVATWARAEEARLSARFSAGIERVSNFRFVAGNDRTNVLASATVVVRP